MKLFQRIFFAAVLAGLAAGLVMSALQQWKVAPLILAAEVYENAEPAPAHEHAAASTDATTAPVAAEAHEHDEDAWAPQDGIERTAYTVLADVLGCLGFALVLVAASVIFKIEITVANGVVWGLCGWIVFHLAPAFGLPPELPGMPAADLAARQTWWWGTAIATAAAFLLVAKWRNSAAIAIAAALILIPHIIGAPPQPEEASAVPAHLATSFAASALTVSAVFWLLVGPLIGFFNELLSRAEAPAARSVPA
ncbi:MAG: CbtA [Devosia sp.]|uniref:CbtA family protein n=1 Tax=Devosia sp. TaxID=1871048 RepID=UPI00260CA760|nr:CbtA family protein [Devosia sp.]MDB5589125.1 CbtA [Devosia sp.]